MLSSTHVPARAFVPYVMTSNVFVGILDHEAGRCGAPNPIGFTDNSSWPVQNNTLIMYIYQSMPDGIPHGPNGENLAETMRVIEVDGQPADVVGIRYKVVDAPPPVGIERTTSGKLVDTGPQSEGAGEQEYWADLPSGCCGGQRLTQTLAEDLAVC